MEYLVEGIGKRRPLKISHDLDHQLASRQPRLPRFERITILRIADGSTAAHASQEMVLEGDQLIEANKSGRFELESGALKPEGTLRIRVVREKLVYIPGSYNLYTPAFTKGLRVLIAECPAEFMTEVWVRPQGEGKHLVQIGNEWWTEELILPGQGGGQVLTQIGAGGLASDTPMCIINGNQSPFPIRWNGQAPSPECFRHVCCIFILLRRRKAQDAASCANGGIQRARG